MIDIATRMGFAIDLASAAGALAIDYFSKRETLIVDSKGEQDWVSEADRNVESFIREQISEKWPEDGIVGEEHATKESLSGFSWVIDPIDGTTNFIHGIPLWAVVLAGVYNDETQLGVIHDPNARETFSAARGSGAYLGNSPMRVAHSNDLRSGTVAVGYSNRVESTSVLPVIAELIDRGAMFHRNASGALSLAYVAAGRLLGYMEEHMNAWDCLAGQLMILEAGGAIEPQSADEMIRQGGRVVASGKGAFEALVSIADRAWSN